MSEPRCGEDVGPAFAEDRDALVVPCTEHHGKLRSGAPACNVVLLPGGLLFTTLDNAQALDVPTGEQHWAAPRDSYWVEYIPPPLTDQEFLSATGAAVMCVSVSDQEPVTGFQDGRLHGITGLDQVQHARNRSQHRRAKEQR